MSIIYLADIMLCPTTQLSFSRIMERLHFTAFITLNFMFTRMSPDQLNGSVININNYYFLGTSQTGYCSCIVLTLTFFLPPTQLGGVCLRQ